MNIKTILVTVVIILVAGVVIYGITNNKSTIPVTDQFAEYFEERLITLGIEDIGRPIEGFDADILLRAFPGLLGRDFNNVETFEGRYSAEGDIIVFVRNQTQPISSAERTVSTQGYGTLLSNVSARLGITASTITYIDTIVSRINTSDTIEANLNQSGNAMGVQITPLEVLEDSRCPSDVVCIQAGTVRVRARLENSLGNSEQIFALNTPITTETETITLVHVNPESISTHTISPSEYRFSFEVKE